ncbi:hypothetical protein, variant [Plasmodium falciparum Vietnam Oak-Knoll (FVO)]|nr:hypothetical protein PFFVO_02378 [Plasmodium falciparum Vietnam Oak-Knoll (FVO)]ETW18479.1 hypothetical protein, variant [Plasmodium falciparum Vietnam Oak-Knoll (FVO)]
MKIYSFYLERLHMDNLLNYIDISFNQINYIQLNIFNSYNIYNSCSYVYVNYEKLPLLPNLVPSLIIKM